MIDFEAPKNETGENNNIILSPAVPESETPVNLENPNSTKELVVATAQMLTLTENEKRLTAAGQAPCEEYVTNKSAVTKEELSKPKTRSRVVLKHQVQKIETSKP